MYFQIVGPNFEFEILEDHGQGLDMLTKSISHAFPTDEIWLFACQRGRLCYVNGELTSYSSVLKDVADENHLHGISPRLVVELEKQFSDLVLDDIRLTILPIEGEDFLHETAADNFYAWTGVSDEMPEQKLPPLNNTNGDPMLD